MILVAEFELKVRQLWIYLDKVHFPVQVRFFGELITVSLSPCSALGIFQGEFRLVGVFNPIGGRFEYWERYGKPGH